MRKFSPEERRGVAAVVAITLILCASGLFVSHKKASHKGNKLEVMTVIARDTTKAETDLGSEDENYGSSKASRPHKPNAGKKKGKAGETGSTPKSKENKSGRSQNSRGRGQKSEGKKSDGKKSVGSSVEKTSRDILSDTIPVKKK